MWTMARVRERVSCTGEGDGLDKGEKAAHLKSSARVLVKAWSVEAGSRRQLDGSMLICRCLCDEMK